MRTYNVSLEQCLAHVVKARPCVLPNDGFLKQLILYDRFLVDRRRQREEAALMNTAYAKPTTEIPIQHQLSGASQPAASFVSAPPQNSANEASNVTSISSVDSSSLGQTSSIQSSTSTDSIHVIPIQIPLKVPQSVKVRFISLFSFLFIGIYSSIIQTDPVLFKENPVEDTPVVQEVQKNVIRLKEKIAATDLGVPSDSDRAQSQKKRQSVLATSITKRSSSETPRSHSAHNSRTHITYSNHFPYPPTNQQWNVVTYYPANQRTSKEQSQTKYITEIYDKATKRFIPATC